MKQILQNFKTGETSLVESVIPVVKPGTVLIRTSGSVISLGTERMLVEFGQSNMIKKAFQQPEKVKQVIQKVKTDGLGSTLKAVSNKLDTPIKLGYSSVGIVEKVGSGVQGFEVNDRVVSNGSHSEFNVVPSNLVAKIPDNVLDENAAYTVIAAIALQGIRLANPTLGETYVVLGLGLIGLITVQLLRANGVNVIGFDFDESKVELAQRYGAKTYAINENLDPVKIVEGLTAGVGVDSVIITASTKSNAPAEQSPKMCRKRGKVILVGVSGLNFNRADFYEKEISFQVSCSYGPGRYEAEYEQKGMDYPIGFVRWTENRNFQAVLDLLSGKKLDFEALTTSRIPLEQSPELYRKITLSKDLGIYISYSKEADAGCSSISLVEKELKSSEGNINLAFIGGGNFAGGTLIPAFRSQEKVVFKEMVGQGGVGSHHQATKYGFQFISNDVDKSINDDHKNTFVVATRHDSHFELTSKILGKGKNLFVEKPLVITLEEQEKLEKQLAHNGLKSIFTVGFNRRFSPLSVKTKELLGTIAGPVCIKIDVNGGFIPSNHWIHDPLIGGGRLVGEGCHFIDLSRFFAASRIVSSYVLNSDELNRDSYVVSLKFENGSIASINYFSSGHKDVPKERVEIYGEGKCIVLDNFRSMHAYGFSNFKKLKLKDQDKGHSHLVEKFCEAIRNDGDLPIPLGELLEVSRTTLELASTLS